MLDASTTPREVKETGKDGAGTHGGAALQPVERREKRDSLRTKSL
jgi:hypothetical protein